MRSGQILTVALLLACQATTCLAVSTLTVLPFTESGSRDHRWLGKGIADILTRNMAAFEQFQLLDQRKLQTYLREMELRDSGFTELDDTLRVARVAKVDQILFGNFRVTNQRFHVEAHVVNLDDQSIYQSVRVAGELSELHDVLNKASVLLARNNGIAIESKIIQRLSQRPTDSLSAIEHYYRAMDAHDHGEYETALAHFVKARQIDPRFADAGFWIGRMFELLNLDAHAVVAYDSVATEHPNNVRAFDANLFAAQIEGRSNRDLAITRFERASNKLPWTSHNVEAAFQLGRANQLAGDANAAYRAYSHVLTLADRLVEPRSRKAHRQSMFFPWHDVLGRQREANVQMISLWRELTPAPDGIDDFVPPRGAIIVYPESPIFFEQKYVTTEPLFTNERPSAKWAERFYAVIAPAGYSIDGIKLKLRGRLRKQNSGHDFTLRVLPFPVPRNFHNSWLGVVYGQTQQANELTKTVPFYGRDQRIAMLQLIENHGEIFDWGFDLSLKEIQASSPLEAQKTGIGHPNDEGFLLGMLELNTQAFAGVTKPLSEHWYEARQTIALSDKNIDGVDVLFVQGDVAEGAADLFVSHSVDGQHWQVPNRLPASSLSNDFSPQLVRAENGDLRAFWISNRRGLGWELWTSVRSLAKTEWHPATRIPLEDFSAKQIQSSHLASRLLQYGVTQDFQGQWVVAVPSEQNDRIVLLVSIDGEHWRKAGSIETNFAIVNPTIIVDVAGQYRVAAFSEEKLLHIWTSNDLEVWSGNKFKVNAYKHIADLAPHRISLKSEKPGVLTTLVSDTKIGLQYARFNPDSQIPHFDLVRGAALEDYALGRFNEKSLVALRRNDAIEFRLYNEFQTHRQNIAPSTGVIYPEYSRGAGGNSWRRIFARRRVIQPDVTAVGVASDGRVWWGIETGIMTLKEDDFFTADVADGFFHHHVTNIAPCGDSTAFASRDLNSPRIGIARRKAGGYSFAHKDIRNATGRITALICVNNKHFAVGTAGGQIALIDDNSNSTTYKFPNQAITALAHNDADDSLLVGTNTGRLMIVRKNSLEQSTEGLPHGAITAIARDRSKQLWIGIRERGVFVLTDGGWRPGIVNVDTAYRSVSHIVADPINGVWMIPSNAEESRGLLYADGTRHEFFRPIDHTLFAPTGLGIGPSGKIWIGTAFDGLFEMTRTR